MQVEPFAVFIQVQLMKHISGSRSISGRFESDNRYLLGFWSSFIFVSEQQTGPFLEISHFSGKYFPRKIGGLNVANDI